MLIFQSFSNAWTAHIANFGPKWRADRSTRSESEAYLLAAEEEGAVDEGLVPASFGPILGATDEQVVPLEHEEPEELGGWDGGKYSLQLEKPL